MERKTAVVDEVVARESRRLAPDEERALRMRRGAAVDPQAPLARAAGDNAELHDELLLMEMQILRARIAQGRTQGLPEAKVAAPRGAPPATRTKEKIVRALRRKR